jgi:Sulfotransferase family
VGQLESLFGRSNPRTPVHFLHIRKTGGTAIAEALKPVARRFEIVLHPHSTRLCDIPPDHRVFFFVRHPTSRFVSGFVSRLRRGAPRYNYEWDEAEAKAFGRFQKANDLAEALSAVDPETKATAREAMGTIGHVNSSYRNWFHGEQELEERLESIVLIGLQETLGPDFEDLKMLLNLPHVLSLPDDEVLAHRTPVAFDRGLTPLAQRNIRKWYAEDLRFYETCIRLRALRTQSLVQGWVPR